MAVEDYARDFIKELRDDASFEQTDAADVFYERTLDILKDNGEFDEGDFPAP